MSSQCSLQEYVPFYHLTFLRICSWTNLRLKRVKDKVWGLNVIYVFKDYFFILKRHERWFFFNYTDHFHFFFLTSCHVWRLIWRGRCVLASFIYYVILKVCYVVCSIPTCYVISRRLLLLSEAKLGLNWRIDLCIRPWHCYFDVKCINLALPLII